MGTILQAYNVSSMPANNDKRAYLQSSMSIEQTIKRRGAKSKQPKQKASVEKSQVVSILPSIVTSKSHSISKAPIQKNRDSLPEIGRTTSEPRIKHNKAINISRIISQSNVCPQFRNDTRKLMVALSLQEEAIIRKIRALKTNTQFRIETLKEDLKLEGKQLQNIQTELSLERKILLQSDKATPSQREALDKLKKAQEKKKEQPKIRNYNEFRQMDQPINLDLTSRSMLESDHPAHAGEEPPQIRKAKAAVGLNSNIRRNNATGAMGYLPKTPSRKIGDEVRI